MKKVFYLCRGVSKTQICFYLAGRTIVHCAGIHKRLRSLARYVSPPEHHVAGLNEFLSFRLQITGHFRLIGVHATLIFSLQPSSTVRLASIPFSQPTKLLLIHNFHLDRTVRISSTFLAFLAPTRARCLSSNLRNGSGAPPLFRGVSVECSSLCQTGPRL